MARLPKSKAIERLQRALNELSELKNSDNYPHAIEKWYRDAKTVVRNTFGETSSRFSDFPVPRVVFSSESPGNLVPLESDVDFTITMIEEMIEEIREYW